MGSMRINLLIRWQFFKRIICAPEPTFLAGAEPRFSVFGFCESALALLPFRALSLDLLSGLSEISGGRGGEDWEDSPRAVTVATGLVLWWKLLGVWGVQRGRQDRCEPTEKESRANVCLWSFHSRVVFVGLRWVLRSLVYWTEAHA